MSMPTKSDPRNGDLRGQAAALAAREILIETNRGTYGCRPSVARRAARLARNEETRRANAVPRPRRPGNGPITGYVVGPGLKLPIVFRDGAARYAGMVIWPDAVENDNECSP